MKPMLDPARDLAGATPETLARALLRNRNLRPPAEGEPAASVPDRSGVVDERANVPVEVDEVGREATAQEPRVKSPHQE